VADPQPGGTATRSKPVRSSKPKAGKKARWTKADRDRRS
jgi:hypothetical protein